MISGMNTLCAVKDDAGNFGSGAINVNLGNVAAGGSHEVKFQVVID